jgi:hypothetical protein
MVIHPLVEISLNKILPRLKANEVESANLEPHSLCYTCWVRVCTHSCISTLLFYFGYHWLLLSARQLGGLRQRLRRLLGVCLPVDVPMAPSSTCISFTLPHSWTDSWFGCNKIIHLRFILLFYVIRVVISWWFCCIYGWLDPGTYMITRFMFFINRVWQNWYQSHIDCRTKLR